MPRRAVREYYDDDPYDDEFRDRPPRRPRRERLIKDDIDYRRRSPSPPIEEFERLRIRERSTPEPIHDGFVPRETRRKPSRRVPREVERDEFEFSDREGGRRKYGGRDSDDEDIPIRKGAWRPPAAPYISDNEESIGRERTRRKEVSPPEWDYGRHISPPRRGRGRGSRKFVGRDSDDDDVPIRKKGWTPTPASYTSDDEEPIMPDRRRARSPPELSYELRDPFPRRSARDELEMEYGMGRGELRHRARSPSPPRSIPRHRDDDEEEIRIRKDVRGRRSRRHGKRDLDEDEFRTRKKRISPTGSPFSRGVWSPDRRPRDRYIEDYELSHPPRAPSLELRSPRGSFDELDPRPFIEKRPRSPDETILREWQDRRSSPSPVRRLSPKHDEWQTHEDISVSRRPRSRERKVDAFTQEWEGPRRSRNALDEIEEDSYRRRGSEAPLNDSAAEEWAIVDPPPRSRMTVDREITQRRYSRERRARLPPGDGILSEDETDSGRRYVGGTNRKERLWTEVTKDLVVREAIERAGYEYEETEFFYYIFDYLQYDEVSALVDLSDDIRRARRRRIHEIHRERTSLPPPLVSAGRRSAPLLLDNRVPSPRLRVREERPRDRELVIEESRRRRPPPPRVDW